MREIFEHRFCEDLNKRYHEFKIKELGDSLNVFTVSKYGTELENFHSDILAILFEQSERHNEQLLFVNKAIDYLNVFYNYELDKNNYKHSKCEREKGRVDLLIVDEVSKHCIIIENKINDAPDMTDQLQRYYEYALNNRGLNVDAIIYLTLNGNKNAPIIGDDKIDDLVSNVVMLSNGNNSMYENWLIPCYEAVIKNRETSSFLYQYGVLLKHLSQLEKNMDLKNDFYNLINNKSEFEKMEAMYALFTDLHSYRAEKFASRLKDNYKPFTRNYKYRPWHWLYMGYKDSNGHEFKFDVHFDKGYGRIDFWIPDLGVEENALRVSKILDRIGALSDFIPEGYGNGFYKVFHIRDYASLEEVDNKLYEYVVQFFAVLKKLEQEKES